jgi:hypothetical protein
LFSVSPFLPLPIYSVQTQQNEEQWYSKLRRHLPEQGPHKLRKDLTTDVFKHHTSHNSRNTAGVATFSLDAVGHTF